MLDYLDFYRISKYCNNMWDGSYTEEEVANNAYIYKCDYDTSIEYGRVVGSMVGIMDNVKYDVEFDDFEYDIDIMIECLEIILNRL